MEKALLKQAAIVPVTAMVAVILWSLVVPHYSSVSQHLSELQLLQHPIAAATRVVPIAVGLSVMAFGAALLMGGTPRMPFTAFCALVFGAANLSNGIFVSGDPRHGLYGLAMFFILVPACFAAELPRAPNTRRAMSLSLATAIFLLTYTWLQFSGLDPHGYRGITQRVAVLVLTGWYTLAALTLLQPRLAVGESPGAAANNSSKPTPPRGAA